MVGQHRERGGKPVDETCTAPEVVAFEEEAYTHQWADMMPGKDTK